MKVETTDIYYSAYLMAKGENLKAMNIRNGGNRIKIIFIFSGNETLNRLNLAFQNGKAQVNPIDLKKCVLHLKDIMYDKLQTYKEEKRKNGNKQRNHRGRQTVC